MGYIEWPPRIALGGYPADRSGEGTGGIRGFGGGAMPEALESHEARCPGIRRRHFECSVSSRMRTVCKWIQCAAIVLAFALPAWSQASPGKDIGGGAADIGKGPVK